MNLIDIIDHHRPGLMPKYKTYTIYDITAIIDIIDIMIVPQCIIMCQNHSGIMYNNSNNSDNMGIIRENYNCL